MPINIKRSRVKSTVKNMYLQYGSVQGFFLHGGRHPVVDLQLQLTEIIDFTIEKCYKVNKIIEIVRRR